MCLLGFPTHGNNDTDRHQLARLQNDHAGLSFGPLRPPRDRPRIRRHVGVELDADGIVRKRAVPCLDGRNETGEEIASGSSPQLTRNTDLLDLVELRLASPMERTESRRSRCGGAILAA